MGVDFTLSEEQLATRRASGEFAANHLSKVADAIRHLPTPEERFVATRPFYQEMVRAGFMKNLLPEAIGGFGTSLLDLAIGSEELTCEDRNVACNFFSSGLGLQPIVQFGTPEQQRDFLAPFLADDGAPLCAFAFSEVGGTANFDSDDADAGIRTHARLEGDEWVINGHKQFITNGSGWDFRGPDLFTIVCRTDLTTPAADSLAVIAVPRPESGLTFGRSLDTIGHRAALSPRVSFENIRVPARNIIGRPGDGLKIITSTFTWSAAMVGVGAVAVMRTAFETALKFARAERRAGSVPIIEHQNVGYMLADIKARLEAARYLVWKAAHHFDETGGESPELPIIAKIHCSELAVQVVYDAMRIVGVESYAQELPLAALLQDALALPLYDGGNMGVRRRQLHQLMARDDYDPVGAAENRNSGRLA